MRARGALLPGMARRGCARQPRLRLRTDTCCRSCCGELDTCHTPPPGERGTGADRELGGGGLGGHDPPALRSCLVRRPVHVSAKSKPSAARPQGSERDSPLPVADLEKLQPTPDRGLNVATERSPDEAPRSSLPVGGCFLGNGRSAYSHPFDAVAPGAGEASDREEVHLLLLPSSCQPAPRSLETGCKTARRCPAAPRKLSPPQPRRLARPQLPGRIGTRTPQPLIVKVASPPAQS